MDKIIFPSDETSPLPAVPSHRFPALLFLICLLEVVAKPTGVAAQEIAIPAVEMVHVETADAGMVVSDAAVASRIGREKLLEGGNAVDAAVATAFALAVAWPDAGNIGGGGFMLVRPAAGTDPVCIDYRETAPLSMNARSFTREDTTFSQKAVGVPGTVRGMAAAHERFGKLPWRSVVMPAAELAAEGVPVTTPLARSLNRILENELVVANDRFAALRKAYGKPDGSRWPESDRMVLPELAATLKQIAEEGPDAFYTGRIAELLVAEMKRGDGLITLEDLKAYEAKIRPAMQGRFRGYTVIGAPPPSSGGTCVIEALNVLENFDLASRGRYDPTNIHLIAETCRRVFADRARYLGDPEFTDIPDFLTSKQHAAQLAASIDRKRATPSEQVAPEIKLADEGNDTTHFSVIDADGMAVSNTYTLENSWGSRLVVPGAGFVLNNEMGDFNWFPGETNRRGRIGTVANTVAGGKRMLSSQSPTIVEKDGEVVLITGSPGGRTIINTVICIVLAVTEFEFDAAEAVAAARMHHQWFPDRLELERLTVDPHASRIEPLKAMGHQIKNRPVQGSAHTIAIDPETKRSTGVADYRRDGRAAGIDKKLLAIWDFQHEAGLSLAEASATGPLEQNWQGGLPGVLTDGRDHLRIDHRFEQPATTWLSLQRGRNDVVVEVKIDSARLTGETPGEQLRIRLGHIDETKAGEVLDSPRVLAELVMARQSDQEIEVYGVVGADGIPVQPTAISDDGTLDSRLLRIELLSERGLYRLSTRKASEIEWTSLGTGVVGWDAKATHVSLTVANDFSDLDEHLSVDRIVVLGQ